MGKQRRYLTGGDWWANDQPIIPPCPIDRYRAVAVISEAVAAGIRPTVAMVRGMGVCATRADVATLTAAVREQAEEGRRELLERVLPC